MFNLLSNSKDFMRKVWQGIRLVPTIRPKHMTAILESLNKKKFLLLGAFAVLVIASGSFLFTQGFSSTGTNPDFGGEHTEGLVGQPRFINPVLATASEVDTDLTRVIYAPLISFDKDLKLAADLAESLPEVSADQKTYTIKLKPNLKWQDGKALTAEDVLFTIQTIQNANFESPLRANWSTVKAEKLDDLTVTFKLREVSASFITNFTLGIIPKHIWSGLTPNNFRLSDKNLQPIGSGPFIVREIKKTADGTIKSITLKSNDQYYAGRPYLDRVNFKFYPDYESLINAYHGKEIDSLGFVPFDKKAFLSPSTKHTQMQISLPQYQAVFFNLTKPVVSDKSVRQALWLTSDRKKIIDEVYMGAAKEAFGPVLEGNLGYNPDIAKAAHNSLDEAKQILDKSGWVPDPETGIRSKNKRPLEINLATTSFVLNVKTAQVLQQEWTKLGATVNLIIVSAADLEQQYIRPRNFDALLFSENTGADPDPFPFWHSSQTKDPGLNLSGFTNSEADKLLTQARQTSDVDVRTEDYQQFQKIIANEIPAIFLNSAVYVYNVPNEMKGLELGTIIHPSERFLDIDKWYIYTK